MWLSLDNLTTGTLAVIDPESKVIGLRLYDSLFKVGAEYSPLMMAQL